MEAYEELDSYMKDRNLTLEGYIKALKKRNTPLLNMSESAYEKYAKCFENLVADLEEFDKNGKHIYTAQERGKILEEMAGLLFFDGNALFDKVINCKTVTNEIDILVNWTKEALQIGINRSYDFIGEVFLCECKNYVGSVDVTYVGKFYSLMKASGTKFGIMFSRNGLSGSHIWVHGKGLARKIALRENIYIIDITWEDFKQIYEKKTNIMKIIDDKYVAMKNDIDYKEYLTKHEMEDEFVNELNKIKG